ncbi:MAG: polyribonucleotide nucleotidyltransferase [Deferribacteraceae bacterium]|jgi:polyribonucleotide nucleotidyltransferase|nr:polyribonucleotide nucleotidyltransferase [Deferribacteraceae bacterium]
MDKNTYSFSVSLSDETSPIIFETGWKAKQANGAVWARQGGTIVLVTAVADAPSASYTDFFPLTVNYIEKFYAVGKFPGGYIKRETKPSDRETLTSRLIDRPLRPMFPEGFRNETQIVATVVSSDNINMPDILALNAASSALLISDIPYTIPVGACRVGKRDGKLIVNPSLKNMKDLEINIIIAATADAIVMVEAGMNIVSEAEVLEALEFGHSEIKKIIAIQLEMAQKVGKPKKNYHDYSVSAELLQSGIEKVGGSFRSAFDTPGKLEKYAAIDRVKEEYAQLLKREVGEENYISKEGFYKELAGEVEKHVFRDYIISTRNRADGRGTDEVRPIDIETSVLPCGHGSSLFTRGETQALVSCTLGSKSDSQLSDTIEGIANRPFALQYNFPPFSVGETGRIGTPGRREIGHGALAERALSYVVPNGEDFPYTVRVVSEILESNGSSSMATVCGGALAMMDAGVPIKAPVAGVAMGLVYKEGKYVVLTDIMGLEDHLGDMDFKVAGTAEGITALQMDIKIKGLSGAILAEALEQAKAGRLHILGKMREALPAVREELAPTAPKLHTLTINTEKIGALIGPQGKNIKSIVEASGASIDIADTGVVSIFAPNSDALAHAVQLIESTVAEAVEGKTYTATVKKIMEYGAFVEIMPGLEGLLHISQYSHERIGSIADYLKVGDKVDVMYMGKDRNGRLDLSRKALLQRKPKHSPKEE